MSGQIDRMGGNHFLGLAFRFFIFLNKYRDKMPFGFNGTLFAKVFVVFGSNLVIE